MIALVVVIVLLSFYAIWLIVIIGAWNKIPKFKTTDLSKQPRLKYSIIIPARNEATNISTVLESILVNQFPKECYELIVVDDHSTDGTSEIVEQIGWLTGNFPECH